MSATSTDPTGTTAPQHGSRLVAVLVALACIVVAAVGLKLSTPNPTTVDIVTVPNRTIELDGAEFVLTRIRAGSTLTFGSDDFRGSATTPGLFLVLTVRLAAPKTAVTMNDAKLTRGSRTYGEYSGQSLGPDAGFVSTADYVFEVDPADLTGMRFQLREGQIIHGIEAQAVVDLGITAAEAAQLRADRGRSVEFQQYPSTEALP